MSQPDEVSSGSFFCPHGGVPMRAWNFTPTRYIAFMKGIVLLPIVALFFATGCKPSGGSSQSAGTNASTSTNSSGGLMQAPVDYINGLGRAKQNAGATADVASLNPAIGQFQIDKGRFPKDLDELVQEKYLTKIPEAPYGMKIEYDASTGTAKVVKK
jgi:hypothetical protein